MGVVYKAHDARLGRYVALKFLPEELTADREALERFEREARAASALNHPGICTIYDLDTHEGRPCIVMELLDGRTLKERLAQTRFGADELIEAGIQVADALAAAHSKGIVHRDIKPANIFIVERGLIKILDFGLAKVTAEVRVVTSDSDAPTIRSAIGLTSPGSTIGTVAYMSPEQVLGEPLDVRTDLFSFGVTLHEMATGELPFQGVTWAGICNEIVNKPARSLLAANPDLPHRLDDIVVKALEKDRRLRYQSAAEIQSDLLRLKRDSSQRVSSAAVATDKSVVVLPFANLSSSPDDEYFSDGLTEELITDLSRIADLRVIPSAASFRLKHADKELSTIGREYKVGYVLEGKVRKAGQSVRITAQLVDVLADRPIWADKYTGEINRVFELQEQVSRAIAEALKVRLRPSRRVANSEAVESYLKGRHFARRATSDGLPKALDCYKQAVQLDPGYADALAALATTYVMITMGWDALPAHDTMPKARTAAKQALELEPNLAEAHTALGMVSMYYDWDLVRAEQSFKEALRLNPNSVEAHIWYVGLLIWLDTRYEEALSHLRHATQLDPVDLLGQVMAGFVYQFSRDFNGAIDHAGRIVALDPLYGFGHYHLGCALVLAGRTNEAIASFERAMELAGRGATFVALSGLAYAVAGQKERALACLDELVAYERAGKNVAAWKVHVSAGLGDADQVISDLEQAVDERASSTLFLFTAPYLDFVRQDPRFIALLRRAGLERLAKYRGYPEWYPPNVPRPAA